MTDLLLLFAGLILLFIGAEGLVRGSSSAAIKFGIKPLVVGLTVVAFGTSAPELVVSVNAALSGISSISMGNIVGSNIANIALILGVAALITPLDVHAAVIKREIPVLIGVSLLLVILFLDGEISLIEGIIFLAGIIVYTVYNIYLSRKETSAVAKAEFKEAVKGDLPVWLSVVFIAAGLGLLIFGADIFVGSAVNIAKRLGLSDAVIGLTIVAVGTSLPELITSIVASYKKEADIAIGNVVGSNIFNILGILGITAVVSPVITKEINYTDLGIMFFFAVILLPLVRTGFKITRVEGLFLVVGYVAYIYYLMP